MAKREWLIGISAAGFFLFASSAAVAGETPSASNLDSRVGAAEQDATQLSQQTNAISLRETKLAQLFGESDEEKAARLQHEQAQDSSVATLNQRVGDVEESLRRLTGQVEQLDHRMSELSERISRMQKDFDYKLCSLASQQLGAQNGSMEQGGLPCPGQGQQYGMSTPYGAGGAMNASESAHLAPPPGVLGTLPRSDLSNQQSAAPPEEMASLDTRPQFEAALNLLAKAQYDEARGAFRGFADMHPSDALAPQAVYWVGDIAYVRRDFAGAARAFAEELKKYPTSVRAPESMLKLGQSLIAMSQKKEGCTALGALATRYPSASKSVTDQALAARKAAGCR